MRRLLRSAVPLTACRACASSSTALEVYTQDWQLQEETHGAGTHRLRRALFRDLCDEMRSEAFTCPPPPLQSWRCLHDRGTNVVEFFLDSFATDNASAVSAFTTLELGDPVNFNKAATFIDTIKFDVSIKRNDITIQYQISIVDKNLEVKNICVYSAEDASERASAHEERWLRRQRLYDGPCIHHLEDDLYNELHDILVQAGMNEAWVSWSAHWISYLEHVEYTRWNLSVQHHILPMSTISTPELINSHEVEIARSPTDTWRRHHETF